MDILVRGILLILRGRIESLTNRLSGWEGIIGPDPSSRGEILTENREAIPIAGIRREEITALGIGIGRR